MIDVLETLNKYIEDQPAQRNPLYWLRQWLADEQRFAGLLALSVVFHLIFYTALIVLNSWAMRQMRPARQQPTEFVVITEVAPPSKHLALRSAPELLERADINRLQYDPENANDTELLSRSPRPSSQRGNGGTASSAQEAERQGRPSRGASGSGSSIQSPNPPAPPAISSGQLGRAPQPESPFIASVPSVQPAPAPAPKPSAGATASNSPESARAGERRGESNESNAFGIQPVQAQYMARVRAKVSKINEANMPHDWIATVLSGKVSATFNVTIKRDGRIQSLEMLRASGYRRLDEQAREAIYIASPFEGYPQNAGETITLTVTVYYTPSR